MRIIDQKGCDYPYESIVISHDDGIICARLISNMDKRYLIAQYSTQDKAEKAMQKLHENYAYSWKLEHGLQTYYRDEPVVFYFPREDEI